MSYLYQIKCFLGLIVEPEVQSERMGLFNRSKKSLGNVPSRLAFPSLHKNQSTYTQTESCVEVLQCIRRCINKLEGAETSFSSVVCLAWVASGSHSLCHI